MPLIDDPRAHYIARPPDHPVGEAPDIGRNPVRVPDQLERIEHQRLVPASFGIEFLMHGERQPSNLLLVQPAVRRAWTQSRLLR